MFEKTITTTQIVLMCKINKHLKACEQIKLTYK